MTFPRVWKPYFCIAVFAGWCLTSPSSAGELSALEKHGKQIYREGINHSAGDVTAIMGKERIEVPASIVPCVGCHGHDGLGRAESGLEPSNITWEALSKPYGVKRADGRQHPPYDERSLKRSFTMGLDAGGNELDTAMPRYRMAHEAAEALVAYLKVLGRPSDPGVDEARIRLGVILPPAGPMDDMRQVIRRAIGAYSDRLNGRGGIYNRKLEIVFLTPPRSPKARTAAIRSLLEQRDVFALTASFLSGADDAIASLIRELEVPLIAAFNLYPDETQPLNRYMFYVGPGLGEQARALLQFAADELRGQAQRAVIVHPREPNLARVSEAMVAQGARQGAETLWSSIEVIDYAPALEVPRFVEDQRQLGTNVVFFLGSDIGARALLHEARSRGWNPYVFLCSPLLGGGVLRELEAQAGRVFLSFPAWSSRKMPALEGLYGELSADYGLPRHHLSVQLSALGAVEVMSEALRLSGRDVTRDRLVDTLEGFDDYDTGLIPRITYGPNRHMGTLGAYVVSFNGDGVKSEWVELRY